MLVLVVVGGILVWQYMTREQARSLKAQPATPLPPLLPADPGLVLPPIAPDRPADAGHPQALLVPDLPGLPQTDPVPHVLSTPASDQGGPSVFHNRNEGLPGGARTHSSRARKAARAKDSDVTQALKNDEWEAHHLVTVAAARENLPLLASAVRGGWRMDAPSNMTALPTSLDKQRKLGLAGIHRPVHDSGHPGWRAEASRRLRAIPQELRNDGLIEGTSDYDTAARRASEDISDRLRDEMLRLGRVSENEEAGQKRDA